MFGQSVKCNFSRHRHKLADIMIRIQSRCVPVRPTMMARTFVRGIQTFDNLDAQLNLTRNGETRVAMGSGGRSSRTGYTATVFGAAGYLGTQVVAKLAKHGTITVAPFREEIHKRHLKVTGDLGVVNFLEFDLRNIQSIEEAVRHSDIVFNMVGRNYPTKNFSFEDVHVEGARRIAEAVKKYNVPRFIHVSSHSVDPESPSEFLRTKAEGEEVVREIVPHATIVRPGPMYGLRDRYLNKIASAKWVWAPNLGKETRRPVLVNDVALALEKIAFDDSTAGKTYELYGPKEYTMAEIVSLVKQTTKNDIREVNLPKRIHQLISDATQYLFWAATSRDEIERGFINQTVDPNALTFADLGITPAKMEERMLHLLRFHRNNTTLHETIEEEAKKKKEEARFTTIYNDY